MNSPRFSGNVFQDYKSSFDEAPFDETDSDSLDVSAGHESAFLQQLRSAQTPGPEDYDAAEKQLRLLGYPINDQTHSYDSNAPRYSEPGPSTIASPSAASSGFTESAFSESGTVESYEWVFGESPHPGHSVNQAMGQVSDDDDFRYRSSTDWLQLAEKAREKTSVRYEAKFKALCEFHCRQTDFQVLQDNAYRHLKDEDQSWENNRLYEISRLPLAEHGVGFVTYYVLGGRRRAVQERCESGASIQDDATGFSSMVPIERNFLNFLDFRRRSMTRTFNCAKRSVKYLTDQEHEAVRDRFERLNAMTDVDIWPEMEGRSLKHMSPTSESELLRAMQSKPNGSLNKTLYYMDLGRQLAAMEREKMNVPSTSTGFGEGPWYWKWRSLTRYEDPADGCSTREH